MTHSKQIGIIFTSIGILGAVSSVILELATRQAVFIVSLSVSVISIAIGSYFLKDALRRTLED